MFQIVHQMANSEKSVGRSGVNYAITRFDGKRDFGTWKMKMEAVLKKEKTYKIVSAPEKLKDLEADVLEEMEDEALTTIQLSLSDEVLREFSDKKTAKELWDALSIAYQDKSLTNRIILQQQLYSFKMKPGSDLMEHVDALTTLVMNLKAADVDITDEAQAVILLCSLPKEYTAFVNSMIYGRGKIGLSDVKAGLHNEVLRGRLASTSIDSDSEGLSVQRGRSQSKSKHGGGRYKSRSQSRGPNALTCNYCKRPGHFVKQCPKLEGRRKDPKQASVSTAVISDTESDTDVFTASGSFGKSNLWLIDSGASYHMTPDRNCFSTYREIDGGEVLMGNDASCRMVGVGSVNVRMFDGVIRTITDVRHVPDLRRSLISVGALSRLGLKIVVEGEKMKIAKGSMIVMKGVRAGNLYLLKGTTIMGESASVTSVDSDSTRLWHLRMGHIGERSLDELCKRGLIDGVHHSKLGFCEGCVLGKQTKVSFGTGEHKAKAILEYVHTDVWGPSPCPSLGGARYFVSFIDDFSRKVWVYFLQSKNETFDRFRKWKSMVEKQSGKKLKVLRSDNGGEFVSQEFINFCESEGIKRHYTTPGDPQSNGVAERMNRTLLERTRCLRLTAKLKKGFWAEALSMAVFLINRTPSSAIDMKIPEEVWKGGPVSYSFLKVFGCPAYVHESKGKLEPRARKCIFLGYRRGVKGYRMWCPISKKIIISRHVTFDEKAMLKVEPPSSDDNMRTDSEYQTQGKSSSDSFHKGTNGVSDGTVVDEDGTDVSTEDQTQGGARSEARPVRQKKKPRWLDDFVGLSIEDIDFDDMATYALNVVHDEPRDYRDAIESADSSSWLVAMEEEIESLQKNHTWDLVPLPTDKRAIGCKWIYRVKDGGNGDLRYKARLVAKGYVQKKGVEYHDIFAPVVRHTSIRILLALVAHYDMELEQLDVKTAFLHGDLDEEIYLRQPEGFIDSNRPDYVCKLNKSLYGLKQSPRLWYKRFDKFMLSQGYSRSFKDQCVYFKRCGKDMIYLLLYVDDMLIASQSMVKVSELKAELSKEFDMKDLGKAQRILGMEIFRDRKRRELRLTQAQYIEKVLARFGMEKAKPVGTPLGSQFKLSKDMSPSSDEDKRYMADVPYSSAVGSLMYAMVCTRPDLAHAVGVVSRYMSNPGKEHWQAVKWILRYLRGTSSVGLLYGGVDGDITLRGYCDSDYAGDRDGRKSVSGYVYTLGIGSISWRSKLQSIVALSTTEAELISIVEATKEGLYLLQLLDDLSMVQRTIELFSDSQSAIHLVENQAYSSRTKHIDVRGFFLMLEQERSKIKLLKVNTMDNPSDMMTKSLPKDKFEHCSNLISLIPTT